jgi:hypothetical protein
MRKGSAHLVAVDAFMLHHGLFAKICLDLADILPTADESSVNICERPNAAPG